MKYSVIISLMLIFSCRTVKEKNEQFNYQREQTYTNWQRQQAQGFQISDSTGRYWSFRTDSAFYYHPDSGLRALSGALVLWEKSLLKQVWSSKLDSSRTEVLTHEKLNTWSRYYRKVKDSKWTVVIGILLMLGCTWFLCRFAGLV